MIGDSMLLTLGRRLSRHLNPQDTIARIGGDQFEVVGIIKSESGQAGNIQIPDQQVDVYISIEVARIYFGDIFTRRTSGGDEREKVELHQIIVRVDDSGSVEGTAIVKDL